MNNKQIGLVIAGCKGGYRLLCSNGVVDTQEEEISRTLSDIRSVIRINRNHLTLYALEFTSQYKVYSVYRSCNDNGSGAFVNIVVYVPHETRIDKIRELLDNMIEYYFKEYVNPLHGTYYPGTYDNINPFSDILQSAEINEETRHFTHRRSKQDDTPSFYIYNDVSEVDRLFESPYRKEFFDCQEVMFMSRTIYESGLDSFSFNREANIITHLSEQEQMPVLCLNCKDVTELRINNIDRNKNGQHSVNLSTDRLSVSVKYRYCHEVTIQGLVSDLLDKGELKLDKDTKTISLGYIEKKYQKYGVGFTFNGGSVPNGLIEIHSDKGDVCAVSDSRVSLSGEWLENEWTICVQPLLGSQNKLVCVSKFKPLDYVNKELNIKLQKFIFDVSVTGSVKGDVFVNVSGIKDPINVGRLKNNSRVELYLPIEIDLKSTEFDPSSPEVELKFDWDSRVLSLNCKVLEYQLVLLPQVKGMLLDWDFKIKNISKKKSKILGGEVVKISPDEDVSRGNLSINGRKFDFKIDEDKILPRLVYIDNPDEVSYKYTTVDSDGNRIVEKPKHSAFFPDGSARKIEATGADVNEEIVDGFTVCRLSRNNSAEKSAKRIGSNKPEQSDIKVTFIGCDGLFYSTLISRNRRACSQQSVTLNSDSEQITVYDKRDGGKRKCVVRYNGEYSELEQKENVKNGFTINHVKNTCTVEYKKSNKNLLIILVAALAVALLSVAAFFVIRLIKEGNDPADKSIVMTVEVKLAKKPDLGEKIKSVEISGVDTKIATVENENGKYVINVYWNKKTANKGYSTLLSKDVKITLEHGEFTKSWDTKISQDLSGISKTWTQSASQPIKNTLEVQTLFQKAYSEHIESTSTTMGEWKELLDTYCRVDEMFINEEAINIILTDASLAAGSGKDFLDIFKDYEQFSAYSAVSESEDARMLETRITDLQKEGEKMWKKLQSNCTKNEVDTFETWFITYVLESDISDELKRHKDFPYTKYNTGINLYKEFFNARSYNELAKHYRENKNDIQRYFTYDQERIYWAYTCEDKAFSDLYSTYGIQFVNPIKDNMYEAILRNYDNKKNK
ncbi:MAG: hypothetical protein IJV84_00320 [Bacteroidales bacterium]|nr:hypothetical protein [Bacteroidales bacterium]